MTGRLLRRPFYVKVRTSEIVADMTRYMAYDGVPETALPQKVDVGRDTPFCHMTQRDGYTYFMRPSIFNHHWEEQAVARYASFNVRAEISRGEELFT